MYYKFHKVSLLLLSSALSFGCAHVSKKDCLEKDWIKVGQSDAAAGKPQANMEKIASSCSRYEMANPPAAQYQLGYELGLKEYCTAELGLARGRDGLEIPSVCPEIQFEEMVKSWKTGLKGFCNQENGKANGEIGLAKSRFCSEAESPKYFEGYKTGAKLYCSQTRKAFELGKSGNIIAVECPSELRDSFEKSYHEGKSIKVEMDALKSRITALNSRISRLKFEMEAIDREIYEAQSRINKSDSRIHDLNREIRDLERRHTNDPKSDFDPRRSDGLHNQLSREYERREKAMRFELSNLESKRASKTLANTLAIHSAEQEKTSLERELRELDRR